MAATIVEFTPTVEALQAQWAAVAELADGLSDDEWSSPSVLPGWSVADIVAHVIGTESMLEGRDVEAVRDVAALDHVRNPIGELNEKWLDHFRDADRDRVMQAYRDVIATRTSHLAAMTQQDFDAEALTPAGRDTYGRFMRIRIFDCWVHEIDLIDSVDGRDGRVPTQRIPQAWALDEIGASLPFVVGKLAGAPRGSRVIFDITGLAPRLQRIEVADRAGAVTAFPDGDESATARLTVDGVELARLVGGRSSADPSTVTISGDEELGKRIVAHLNYMI